MQRTWLAPLLGALILTLTGCPDTNNPLPDAGEPDAGLTPDAGPPDGSTEVPDAGPPPCTQDDDCSIYGDNLRCQTEPGPDQGQCIPGMRCNVDSECNSADPDNYCLANEYGGVGCRCVEEKSEDGFNGVCRRRRAACSECTTDAECGTGSQFNEQGACRQVGDEGKFCVREQKGASCGCGYVNDGQGFCIPQLNTCSTVGCTLATEDEDCAAGNMVCDAVGDSCGTCVPRCGWDFLNKRPNPECPSGKVCWVDAENVAADSSDYGAGRCRAPCTSDGQCQDTVNNPVGGDMLVCRAEQLAGGGSSQPRCRPDGACMDDNECPVLSSQSTSDGYCDRQTRTCKEDCRVGTDPVTGLEFDDCRRGYKCEYQPDNSRQCIPKTCVELGGAAVACLKGQLCCGEDLDGDGVAEPCNGNVDPETKCYEAPKPPFCTACTSNDDCQKYAGQNPNKSPLKFLCGAPPEPPEGRTGPDAVCYVPTQNKPKFDQKGCPAGYAATQIGVPCQSNDDCRVGNSTGLCEEDPARKDQDGNPLQFCACTVDDANSDNDMACPSSAEAGGLKSFCPYGLPGAQKWCAQTILCVPDQSAFWGNPGAGIAGCGF